MPLDTAARLGYFKSCKNITITERVTNAPDRMVTRYKRAPE